MDTVPMMGHEEGRSSHILQSELLSFGNTPVDVLCPLHPDQRIIRLGNRSDGSRRVEVRLVNHGQRWRRISAIEDDGADLDVDHLERRPYEPCAIVEAMERLTLLSPHDVVGVKSNDEEILHERIGVKAVFESSEEFDMTGMENVKRTGYKNSNRFLRECLHERLLQRSQASTDYRPRLRRRIARL